MTTAEQSLNHGISGFAVALEGVAKTASFSKLIPLTDNAVIGAITHPASLEGGTTYSGDADLIGVALTKGVCYPVAGTTVTMSTGKAMLIRY